MHLGSQLAPPLGILTERFPTLLFCPLKNYMVKIYLSIEPVIFQECIGHLSLARGLFQSQIPCGRRASQAMRENLAKQQMIVSIRCHLHIDHTQMSVRISSAIILDKLKCSELGRHNNLREIGQTVQINTSSCTKALYDMYFLNQGLHLTFDLTVTRLCGLILRRIHFRVIPLWIEWQRGVALIRIQQWLVLIFKIRHRALQSGTREFSIPSYNQLLHYAYHFCRLLFQENDLMSVFLNGGRTTSRHLFSTRPSDDRITV